MKPPSSKSPSGDLKRSELGTWYPPGELVTIYALRLAAKHGSATKALASIEKTIRAWHKNSVEIDGRIVYQWERTRLILRFWAVAEASLAKSNGTPEP